jgi:hypothetical protein
MTHWYLLALQAQPVLLALLVLSEPLGQLAHKVTQGHREPKATRENKDRKAILVQKVILEPLVRRVRQDLKV